MNQIAIIQVLRAVAALMVVFSHGQIDAAIIASHDGSVFSRTSLLPWDTGVDLFFVVSGFIMVYASERLFATADGSGTFLRRRIVRIVPLYWIATVASLLVIGVSARMGHVAFPPLADVMTSLGFIPHPRAADGAIVPVVTLGWTLNYEMFFYVVFALFVRFHRATAVLGVSLALMMLVILGALLPSKPAALAYWSDPIVLEFVLGMWIAQVHRLGFRLDRRVAATLAVLGVLVLLFDLDGMTRTGLFELDRNGLGRLLAYGIPMALVFASATLVPPRAGRSRIFAAFALVGDASYALYLFHPFALLAGHKAYAASGLAHIAGYWPLVVLDLCLAIGLALLVHLFVERSVTARLNQWLARRNTAASKPLVLEARPLS